MFFGFIGDYCVYSTCLSVRNGFYTVLGEVDFEGEVLLGACWFVVDICDVLAIYVFYKIFKNGNYIYIYIYIYIRINHLV